MRTGACGPGIVIFDREYPGGIWDVTPDSCAYLANKFPWDWLAENILSGSRKTRYLRVLAVQREWYLSERQKLIDRAKVEGNGIADDGMKMQMASIESTYKETRAAAFCAAASMEDINAL